MLYDDTPSSCHLSQPIAPLPPRLPPAPLLFRKRAHETHLLQVAGDGGVEHDPGGDGGEEEEDGVGHARRRGVLAHAAGLAAGVARRRAAAARQLERAMAEGAAMRPARVTRRVRGWGEREREAKKTEWEIEINREKRECVFIYCVCVCVYCVCVCDERER